MSTLNNESHSNYLKLEILCQLDDHNESLKFLTCVNSKTKMNELKSIIEKQISHINNDFSLLKIAYLLYNELRICDQNSANIDDFFNPNRDIKLKAIFIPNSNESVTKFNEKESLLIKNFIKNYHKTHKISNFKQNASNNFYDIKQNKLLENFRKILQEKGFVDKFPSVKTLKELNIYKLVKELGGHLKARRALGMKPEMHNLKGKNGKNVNNESTQKETQNNNLKSDEKTKTTPKNTKNVILNGKNEILTPKIQNSKKLMNFSSQKNIILSHSKSSIQNSDSETSESSSNSSDSTSNSISETDLLHVSNKNESISEEKQENENKSDENDENESDSSESSESVTGNMFSQKNILVTNKKESDEENKKSKEKTSKKRKNKEKDLKEKSKHKRKKDKKKKKEKSEIV